MKPHLDKKKIFLEFVRMCYPRLEMSDLLGLQQNKTSTAAATSAVGAAGELLAAEFLERAGYLLAAANFKVPVGRNARGAQVTGEIDLIAYDTDVLCFVEVKTRSSDEFASPLAAVDLRKQRQIIRAARMYRKIFALKNAPFRYDVVSIVLRKAARPEIELFKNYFTEAKFRKNSWADEF